MRRCPPLSRTAAALLLTLLCSLAFAPRLARAQDLLDDALADDPLASLIDDFQSDLDGGWWNNDWAYRWELVIDDPQAMLSAGKVVYLDDPRPLMLINARYLQPDGADLRLVGPGGRTLPVGIVNLPLDDGSCQLWCRLPDSVKLPLRLWLYAGNPKAKPDLGGLPPNPGKAPHLPVTLLGEERNPAPGSAPAPGVDNTFFDQFIFIEAENFKNDQGVRITQNFRGRPAQMTAWTRDDASGGAALWPYQWRTHDLANPPRATAIVPIPRAGQWRLWVRYKVTHWYSSVRSRPFLSFDVQVGPHQLRAGVNQEKGASFRWDHFDLQLPAGDLPITLTFDSPALADCLLLTQNLDYLPDYLDFSGNPWMRFRIPEPPKDRHQMPRWFELYAVHSPWAPKGAPGSTTAWLFDRQIAAQQQKAADLARDSKHHLKPGQWTPWVQSVSSRVPYWWNELRPVVKTVSGRDQLAASTPIEFEFATRPIAARVFNRGVEQTLEHTPLRVIMPTSTDFASLTSTMKSFGQWAQARLELAQSIGFTDKVDPAPFVSSFMANRMTSAEADLAVRTASWLGFNTLDVGHDASEIEPHQLRYHLPRQTVAHHWYPKPDLARLPTQPAPGQTYEQTLRDFWAHWAHRAYFPAQGEQLSYFRKHAKLIIMGDEVGPAIATPYIELLPLLLGHFREYLQAQGLEPSFFGCDRWDQVMPKTYSTPRPGSEQAKHLKAIVPGYLTEQESQQIQRDQTLLQDALDAGIPTSESTFIADSTSTSSSTATSASASQTDANADADPSTTESLDPLDLLDADMRAEERRASAEVEQVVTTQGTLHEKRLYHWTQKYRGHFTQMHYELATQAIARAVEAGHIAPDPYASPNFQAMPVHKGRQWDGALNIFDLARSNSLRFLMVEDWSWTPYKIAFGMTILRSAASKQGQPLGALIVGSDPMQRYLMDLAQGSRVMHSYLYGPLRVIGPPWANDGETYRQFGTIHRWLAKLGPDLVQARNRPADVAILMANTTEINHIYHPHNIWERQNIFAGLAYERWPADVVSEEAIIEDPDALAQYKVLYVGDPHVDSRAQQRIAQWVNQGGILWSFYGGLSRQEYDEPSSIMNPVFGLASREEPALPPTGPGGDTPHRLTIPASEHFPELTLTNLEHQPTYVPAGADVVATFPDGSPAILRHQHGQGQAWLLGFSSRYAGVTPEARTLTDEEIAARHTLITHAAQLANLTPHARCDAPDSMVFVHDGPRQTVAYIVATNDVDHPAVTLAVRTPSRPTRVTTGDADDVPFTYDDGYASVTLNLPKHSGAIIVYHHE